MAKIEAQTNGPALLFVEQRVRQDGEDMEVRARIVPLGAGQHLTRSFHPKLVNDQFHTCIADPKAILQSRHGTKSSIMSRIQRAYDPYLLRRELPVGEFQSHKVKFQNKDSELHCLLFQTSWNATQRLTTASLLPARIESFVSGTIIFGN